MFGHNSTGFGWGKKGVAQNLGQTIALNHYNRVTAAGGVLPCGVAALAAIINAICTALGLTTEAQFQAAVPQGLDPHYSGYLAGAGSGTTLGQACQKIFNWAGASGDVSQGTAGSMPLLLAYDGVNKYYWNGGVIGNYCSTPNAAINQISGDIELISNRVFKVLTGGGYEVVGLNKYTGVNSGYLFEYNKGDGKLYFNSRTITASTATLASVGITINTRVWIKVNRQSSTGDVKFYYSLDSTTDINSVNWTQLGATISSTSGAFGTTTTPVYLGVYRIDASGEPIIGSEYRATLSNTIGGSPVVDFNPNTYNAATSQTSWVSATSETWTINIGTATTGYKAAIVDKTIVQYDGVDDRLSATGLFNRSVLTKYVCERYSKPAAYMTSNASNSFLIYTNGGGIPRAAAATEVVFTGTTMFTKLDILTAVFGASGVTMVNNANQATGDLSGNSGTELYLGSGSTANYMNCLINTYIEVNSANDSTQRTAMWNVIKTMNNL